MFVLCMCGSFAENTRELLLMEWPGLWDNYRLLLKYLLVVDRLQLLGQQRI